MSIYLPEKKALILHVPKTGGTWIKRVLKEHHRRGHFKVEMADRKCWRQRPRKHTPFAHFHLGFLSQVDYTAAFVRDPCDFYLSTWKWFQRFKKRDREDQVRLWYPLKEPKHLWHRRCTFSEWVQKFVERYPVWLSRFYDLYVGPKDSEYVDFIGRTETLEEDLYSFLVWIGYDVPRIRTPPINKTPAKYKATCDAASAKCIKKNEQEIYQRFYGENTGLRFFKERMIKAAITQVYGQPDENWHQLKYKWLWETGDRKWNT